MFSQLAIYGNNPVNVLFSAFCTTNFRISDIFICMHIHFISKFYGTLGVSESHMFAVLRQSWF